MLHYQLPVFNINTVIEKHQTFLCEFVELKRNGFHHYTRALDNLTYMFWQPWLLEQEKAIDQLADQMKQLIKVKL